MKTTLLVLFASLVTISQTGCCGVTPCEATSWAWDKVTDVVGVVVGCIG